MRATITLLAVAAVLSLNLAARAEDWPKWRGPRGDGISTEAGLAESWPKDGPQKLWTQPVGIGFSSPVAVDGKVYLFSQTGDKDILTVFDADTGKVLWTQSYQRGEDPQYPGTRATPTIDSGRIYTYGSHGDLVCRELADGKLVWHSNVLSDAGAKGPQWGTASCPLVTADLIYVQAGRAATAVAVDKKTGALAWKSEAKGIGGYAAPIIIEADKQPQLIIFGGDALYGMDPKTGATLWTEPWRTGADVNAAVPIFDGKHLFVTSEYNHGDMMLTVSAQSAKREWENKDVQCKFQPPILENGVLYLNSSGTLKCVSWPQGKVLWTRGRELRLGAGGSLVHDGDKLITLGERGLLTLAQATPADCKIISQVQVFDYSHVWSTPLIYRGKLYLKGENTLMCMDISAAKP